MKLFKKKPRTDNKTESVDEDYSSHLAASGEVIEESSGRDTFASVVTTFGGGVKFIIGLLVFAVVVIAAIYTFLAGTLMFAAPTDEPTKKIWVARGTFQGGQIDTGKIVYGSSTTLSPTNFFGKVTEGYTGADEYFVIKTLAGPVSEVSSSDGNIFIDGEKTEHKGEIQKSQLVNQYLGQCIVGDACVPGEYVIVDYPSVSGEVRGVLSPSGLSDIDAN